METQNNLQAEDIGLNLEKAPVWFSVSADNKYVFTVCCEKALTFTEYTTRMFCNVHTNVCFHPPHHSCSGTAAKDDINYRLMGWLLCHLIVQSIKICTSCIFIEPKV